MEKKNILFTVWYANGFHGGVMHIAEIGKYLNSIGWSVYCATVNLTEDIKKYWQEMGIEVYACDKLPTDIHYDIVWTLHFPILSYLILRDLKYSKIIYNSLSAFLDLETPALFDSKYNLILAVSKECKNSLIERAIIDEDQIKVLNNLVPIEYFDINKKNKKKISKIAIVSNHPPKEILETAFLFEQENIKVDIYGQKYKYIPITPDLLSQYDVIVSIGKTVQYSLAMGIPCYNYDYFGGSGYITASNIDKEEEFNFSGRSYKTKKTPNEIVNKITSQYSEMLPQMEQLKEIATERYSLPKKIDEIIDMVEKTPDIHIDIKKNYLTLIQNRFIVEETLNYLDAIKQLENQVKEKNYNNAVKNKWEIYLKYYRYKLINFLLKGKSEHYLNKYILFKKLVENVQHSRKKLTAIMCVKNEEYYLPGFLKHIEKYVDGIVAVDDGSVDNTVNILKHHPLCEEIIELKYHESDDWNEAQNRQLVINLAEKIGSDWVLCCDPDERFEENFLKNIRTLINNEEKVCYHINIRELWDNYKTYRCDGIWNKKEKGVLFPLLKNMDFNYNQNHHIPWHPKEIKKHKHLDYNLYHFKMLKEENRKKRMDLYNKLDPNKEMQKIGYDYLVSLENIQLKKIPFWKKYSLKTIPKDIIEYKKHTE